MTIRSLLFALLALLTAGAADASKPEPMIPTALPVERPLAMTLLIPNDLFVLQEDQINVYYLPMPGNYALTTSQTFAYGASLGVAASLVTEGIALTRRIHDRKRLASIEAAVGKVPWGERLQTALRQSLATDGLASSFEFSGEVPRKRVGSKVFDAPGRAWGMLEGHVAFTPNLRGIRIHLVGLIEDRRVIRDTKLRLQLERLPLRQVAVEYLIALPDDVDLGQKKRTQRWAEQSPEVFAAAIDSGIAETVRLINANWQLPDAKHLGSGEPVSFRLDKGLAGKGQVLTRDDQRVLIADTNGMLHSVPVALLDRGYFD